MKSDEGDEDKFDYEEYHRNMPVEPLKRLNLPWEKDPTMKPSLWGIVKENIGKDLSRVTLPVTFNEPLSLSQKGACATEQCGILNAAADIDVSTAKRCGMVAICRLAQQTNGEKDNNKPFNAMLGETYEIVDGDVLCLCEQVSHHPPITATYITNPKLGWRF